MRTTLLVLLLSGCSSPPVQETRRAEPIPEPVPEAPPPVAEHEEEPAPVAEPERDGVAPTAVEGIADAIEVAVGRSHTCVRRASGVSCWGASYAGQLGPAVSGPYSARAVDIPTVTGAVEIFAGAAHTCARREDGSVVCWGDNRFEQLGGGSADEHGPRAVSGVLGATGLAGNLTRTCAVLANGRARCWGRYLGHDYAMSDGYVDPSLGVGRVRNIVQLGIAESYGCALLRDARISCWGQNEYGQLGRHTPGDGFSPIGAAPIPSLSNIAQISIGASHACARARDGHVSCWGADSVGEIGGSAVTHEDRSTVPPTRVPGIEHAAEISTIDQHTCARLDDGHVSCWGSNVFGELGAGGYDDSGPIAAWIDDAVDIAAGEHHTCAVRRSGAVWCWGRNECGEVGVAVVPDEGWECSYQLDRPQGHEGGGGLIREAD